MMRDQSIANGFGKTPATAGNELKQKKGDSKSYASIMIA